MDLRVFSMESIGANVEQQSTAILKWLAALDKNRQYYRKFLTLVRSNNERICLVIGPKFVDEKGHPDFYMHRHLRQRALQLLDSATGRYDLKGGGLLIFRKALFTDGWQVELGGDSSDYGVWDYRLLDHQRAIADWFKIRAVFNWRGQVDPSDVNNSR